MFCNKKEVLISQQRARSILWFCLPCVSSNCSEYAGRVEKSLCVCVCLMQQQCPRANTCSLPLKLRSPGCFFPTGGELQQAIPANCRTASKKYRV